MTVGGFWACSDLPSNAQRGVLAEYLITAALGAADRPRVEWDAYDLLYQDKRIEVRSAAYVQTWKQTRLSKIEFSIGLRRAWYAETNTYSPEPVRCAGCYVFCLCAATERERSDPLNLDLWQFFVVPTPVLDEAFGEQKKVSLARLKQLCTNVSYSALRQAIDQALLLS